MSDSQIENLTFLAQKSADFIEKQVTAYRQKHSNAGSLITIIALFIPFFLSGLDDSYVAIKVLSIIPVALLIWSIILLIGILKTKSLDHGFHTEKFRELVNKPLKDALIYEIGANMSSFSDNEKIINQTTKNYGFAIKLIVISIILSSGLLVVNKFVRPEAKNSIYQVEIIKPIPMSNDNNNGNNGGGNSGNDSGNIDIPYVPPTDRTNLNESITPQPSTSNPSPNIISTDKGE